MVINGHQWSSVVINGGEEERSVPIHGPFVLIKAIEGPCPAAGATDCD